MKNLSEVVSGVQQPVWHPLCSLPLQNVLSVPTNQYVLGKFQPDYE